MGRILGVRYRSTAALAALLLSAWVGSLGSSASAAPIFFTGPTTPGGFVLGVSEADAFDSGLDILSRDQGDYESVARTDLTIDNSTVAGSVFSTPEAALATQDYAVTNDSGPDPTDPRDTLYLVFVSMSSAVVGDDVVDYDPTTVGVNLTDEWVMISFFDPDVGPEGQDLYFPAISLDTLALQETTTVPIEFVLTEPVWTLGVVDGELGAILMLPQMLVDGAFVPIPEPSTGVMISLGLCVLAWRSRSRRSCSRA